MRAVNKIILHCSDSDHAHHDNVQTIFRWHVVENGWSDIGYHFVITKGGNGALHFCRHVNTQGAHAKGNNEHSIGICITGKYEFSIEQICTAVRLCRFLRFVYPLTTKDILGHYEVNEGKTCPNFNMDKFRRQL